MAKKTNESPFQALEEEAYHAYREWPLWLVLRERDLAAHLAPNHPSLSAPLSRGAQAASANLTQEVES